MRRHSVWVELWLTHGTSRPLSLTRRYELALRPHLQDRIVEEAQEILGDNAADRTFEYEQLKQLKFLEMVMKEVRGCIGSRRDARTNHEYNRSTLHCSTRQTLRLHPPVPFYGRYTLAPIQVGPFTIPANVDVFVCPNVLHRLHAFWERPEEFDPERFSPERSNDRHPYCFVPFSAGGMHVAHIPCEEVVAYG